MFRLFGLLWPEDEGIKKFGRFEGSNACALFLRYFIPESYTEEKSPVAAKIMSFFVQTNVSFISNSGIDLISFVYNDLMQISDSKVASRIT